MSSAQKSSGKSIIATVLVVLLAIIAIVVVAEVSLRSVMSNSISSGFQDVASSRGVTNPPEPEVSFPSGLVLPSLVTKNVEAMTIDTPNTLQIDNAAALSGPPSIVGDPAALVQLSGVNVENREDPVAEQAVITVTLPPELLQALANRNQGLRLNEVRPQPDSNTFAVELDSGFAGATLRPIAQGSQLQLKIEGASVLGLDLGGLADLIGQATSGLTTVNIPDGLEVQDASVTEEGLRLELHGRQIPLSTIANLHFDQ